MLLLSVTYGDSSFVVHENCELVDEKWNDGDSFHVKLEDGTKQVFRLYGVDCIETNHKEEFMKSRLDAQAYYFGLYGKDSEKERLERMIGLGKLAAEGVKKSLRDPFTVITQNKSAGGLNDSRSFCYVITKRGSDLGEWLVRAGLARVYGSIDRRPGVGEGVYKQGLYDMEMTAIGMQLGAWKETEWKYFARERKEYRKLTEKLFKSP
ncbi:MAG: thermonuclease family protein [Akkermansiaceae bacterium]